MRIKANSSVFLAVLMSASILAMGLAEMSATGQAPSSQPASSSLAKTSILKTPRGRPDLQGTWNNTVVVPFERPKEFGDRQFLTDAEHKKAIDELIERIKLPGPRDSREGRGTEKDVARAFADYWFGDKPTKVGRRTSTIIDPPDGRMPAYTPERQERIRKQREYLAALLQGTSGGKPGPISPLRYQPPPGYYLDRMNRADGPEDRSSDERCFLNGLPVILQAGPLTPNGRPVASFGGAMRIIESPDSVDIFYDIGQGTGFDRVIPITSRAHLPKEVRQYWGDSIGRWEGDTLVVDVSRISLTRQTFAVRAKTCT